MDQPVPNPAIRMTRADYYAWAAAQPRGRFELMAGQVVPMSPERAEHIDRKAIVWMALRNAVAAAGLRARAYADGMTVEIDDDTAYEPDALVNLGDPVPRGQVAATNPVIVVEVLSPGTRSIDTGRKLADYFRVPSIQHYLIVLTDRPAVIHHRRQPDGSVVARVVEGGTLRLDPPGLAVEIAAIFAD